MNVEQPRGISRSLRARRYHRNNLILLVGPKFWPSPSNPALFTGSIQATLGSFAEDCPFELGKRSTQDAWEVVQS